MNIDLASPAFYGDLDGMHAAFTWLRANDPVHLDANSGLWGITKHADLADVERDAVTFSSLHSYRLNPGPGEDNMIAQDDPGHLDQRRLVNRRFTPRAVRDLGPKLRTLIDELIDHAAGRRRMEVVHDLAAQLPARLTAQMLGFPEERWTDVQSWSERLMRLDFAPRDQDVLMGVMSACYEFNALLQELVPARRECPMDDLVSVWANAQLPRGPMSDDTIFNETGLFISGGAETTRTVISRGLHAFTQHPDQWEAMAADPSLVPSAVEEVIRWVTPLNNMFRTATRDVELRGKHLPRGARVALLYPSANRDEDVFDDPFTFDIRRDPNPHLAFGQGTHFCLGAALARYELRLLFEALSQRFTNLRVVSPPDIEANIFVGAVRRFELEFDVRG
jgi:cytochrome P450 family 142 subfamily A polypeptide 1